MNHQQHTIEVYNQNVKGYMDKFMDLELYKATFSDLLKLVPSGAQVLELGCGPGNVTSYIKSIRADLQITGIDLAPNMIKAARKVNPESRFETMDIRDIHKMESSFDAVIAAFCIPYLSPEDLPALFAQLRRLTINRKGLVYVSFMEGPRERSGFEQTSFTGTSELYIEYYPTTMITSLLKLNDLTIRRSYTQDYHEADGSITKDLIYIAD
jgi:ubiquinone/menaquinone biosynthesis C-methylase UbiE